MKHSNRVELVSWHGSDTQHAHAAWVSTGTSSKDKEGRIGALLHTLAENKHGTPFEHSQLTFLVTTELATHIQMLRHRHLSFNVESARYKEIKDDRFYVPTDWTDEMKNAYIGFAQTSFDMYHTLIEAGVQAGLSRSRMKESARFVRIYGAQISYYVTFNFRSFTDFLDLRVAEPAQKEIHNVGEAMLELVKQIPDNPFKYSLSAFGY